MDTTSLGFPFQISALGQVAPLAGDDNIKAKIMQILLTTPGERVELPEFGCGLRDLVFDPNNDILAAATEFTINKALQRWMSNDIIVEAVDASSQDDVLTIEVTYLRRDQLERSKLKIAF
jgi:phage baseplate assembly protein W